MVYVEQTHTLGSIWLFSLDLKITPKVRTPDCAWLEIYHKHLLGFRAVFVGLRGFRGYWWVFGGFSGFVRGLVVV